MQEQFYYVYDPLLSKFLKFEKNIRFITTGLNPQTKRQFWMYWNNDEVSAAMDEFEKQKREILS
jgi:hypothetical protein